MPEVDDRYYDRFATFREHAELRERTATLEATMVQIGPTLSRIETMVATNKQAPAQQETAAALALHRLIDAAEKKLNGGNSSPALTALAIIGACALTAAGMWLLLHR